MLFLVLTKFNKKHLWLLWLENLWQEGLALWGYREEQDTDLFSLLLSPLSYHSVGCDLCGLSVLSK